MVTLEVARPAGIDSQTHAIGSSSKKVAKLPGIVTSTATCAVPLKGSATAFAPKHLLLAVIAAQGEKSLASLEGSLKRKLDFAFPATGAASSSIAETGFTVPSRWTLARAQISLDLASMAFRRDVNRTAATVWRSLNVDASPQGGIEIFGMRETIVWNANVETLEQRTLPLQSLGQGHCGLTDKQACVANAIFLEAGPGLEDMANYCDTVYSIATDLGVEFSVADTPDFMTVFLGGDVPENARQTYMFRNCMRVPDWNHLLAWQTEMAC
eukprot:1022873-Amphidinium_carterae.1